MIVVSWLSAAYLLALVSGYYLDIGNIRRHNIESASFIFVAVVLAAVISRRPAEPSQRTSESLRRAPIQWIGLMFLGIALLLYAPVITAGLFADDFVLLEAAREGRWTVWTELFRPTIFVVWRGLDALPLNIGASLHLLNIALHALNATMVAALAYRLGLSTWAGVAAGALFVCFPASVEAVAWPAGVQDVLMTSFVLGFLLVLTTPRLTPSRAVTAVGLLIGACLTKETGVTAIALAVLVCVTIRAPRSRWVVVGTSAAVVALLLAVRFAFVPFSRTMWPQLSRYEVKELLVRPFATLLVPLREAEATALPWVALGLVVVVVTALVVSARRWNRRSARFHVVLLGAGFVLVSIAAVNTLFFVTGDLMGSRYLYLASVGWAILLATILYRDDDRFRIVRPMLAAITLVCWAAAASAHIQLWKAAGAQRKLIVEAAEKAGTGCRESVVLGLPQVTAGVPLFLNGFPEAMRERVPAARFRVDPAAADFDCRLKWTGSEFLKQ